MKSFVKVFCLVFVIALLAAMSVACGCEHTYEAVVSTEATCEGEGVTTYTCSQCGDSYTEPIAAKGHSYKDTVTEPTCEEDGFTTHTCSVCNDTYTDSTVAATGHSYASFVTAPTCSVDGFTTHICPCGHTYTDTPVAATGVHTYVMGVAPLTEEQAALNPLAIGVEAEVCSGCGATSGTVGDKAVLVNITFDKVIDAATYEGSDTYKSCGVGDAQRDFAIQIDSEKNIDVYKDKYGYTDVTLVDGKAVMGGSQIFLQDNLQLITANAAFSKFTVTFDFALNCDLTQLEEKHKEGYIFGIANGGLWTRYIHIALGREDLDTGDGKTFELIVKSANGNNKTNLLGEAGNTGVQIRLGREYSFKMEIDAEAKTVAVYYKNVEDAEYILAASYENVPLAVNNGSYTYSTIHIAHGVVSAGNTIDNIKITTDLVK